MKPISKILIAGAAVAMIGTGFATAQGIDEARGARAEKHEAHADGDRREGGNRQRGGMLRQMFETFDLNGDGSLTQEEIDTARAQQLSGADTDGDGALSIAEYETLWLEAMRERMVDAYQRHDADGDGSVTAEEFNARFDGLVERMDRNDDGALNGDDRRGGGRREAPAE